MKSYPNRIVCLAAETPEILHELGALELVVGISAYTKRPPEALSIPKVSGFQHGSIERILACEPDLVILTSDVQKELAAKLSDAGVHTLHFHPHRLTDLFDIVTMLGNIVGKSEEAARLNARLQKRMETIRRQAERFSWHPRVYFEEWMDPVICGTAWVSDLIELAGGSDVFRDISVRGHKAQHRIVDEEVVLRVNPNIVLASWCGKPFDEKAFLAREGFSKLRAVEQKAVYEVDSQILQFGPMLVDSLEEIFVLIKEYTERLPEGLNGGQ